MEFLIFVACAIVGIVTLGAILIVPLRIRFSRQLRKRSRKELEDIVFRFEPSYFNFIGKAHPDVLAFEKLVRCKDLRGIRLSWSRLSRSFRKLEIQAGHRGRPLIMDYYNWYELELRELGRRGT